MAGPRDYSQPTRAALAVLSRGTCYFPDCQRPVIVFIDDEPYVDVHIAHISDAKPGNRYDVSMTDDERRSFGNLILLCKPHHDLVDRAHPNRYRVEDLAAWKANRERDITVPDLNEESLEDALKDAAIDISVAGSLQVGGTGGSAIGAGGGGGGVIGSGTGGPGGPGGSINVGDRDRISLDGTAGQAPGAGGGGGGLLAAGAVTRPANAQPTEGVGYSAGEDGSDGGATSISDAEGNVLVSAPGGEGGLAGKGVRLDSELISVSALMLVNYAELRDGLAFVAGGGWESISILNLPDVVGLPVFAVLEAAGVAEGEYTIGIEARSPDGLCRSRTTFPLTIVKAGDVVRVPRCCNLRTEIDSFGLWRLVVDTAGRELAAITFLIKRTGEV